jgi:hypothetical protein
MIRGHFFVAAALVSLSLIACSRDEATSTGDDTLYLTGTEELALEGDGGYYCPSPKKVLICHIPPGNPANSHTICVSTNAVQAHADHHGDLEGACAAEAAADAGSIDEGGGDTGGETTDAGTGTSDPDAGVVIN